MSLTFIRNGKEVSADALRADAPKRPARVAEQKNFHKGWRVEGFPPGFKADSRELAESLTRDWTGLPAAEQALAIKRGERAPKPWNEQEWLRNTRKKPVRAKPYEVHSAAQQCAGMAIKAGWTDVSVVELSRNDGTSLLNAF